MKSMQTFLRRYAVNPKELAKELETTLTEIEKLKVLKKELEKSTLNLKRLERLERTLEELPQNFQANLDSLKKNLSDLREEIENWELPQEILEKLRRIEYQVLNLPSPELLAKYLTVEIDGKERLIGDLLRETFQRLKSLEERLDSAESSLRQEIVQARSLIETSKKEILGEIPEISGRIDWILWIVGGNIAITVILFLILIFLK